MPRAEEPDLHLSESLMTLDDVSGWRKSAQPSSESLATRDCCIEVPVRFNELNFPEFCERISASTIQSGKTFSFRRQ